MLISKSEYYSLLIGSIVSTVILLLFIVKLKSQVKNLNSSHYGYIRYTHDLLDKNKEFKDNFPDSFSYNVLSNYGDTFKLRCFATKEGKIKFVYEEDSIVEYIPKPLYTYKKEVLSHSVMIPP